MGFYSYVIFPGFYDCLIDKPHWNSYRQDLLANVDGEILEIGVGTGLNLPHNPSQVSKITTADPNPGMNKRLERRIKRTGISVDVRVISSEILPFGEDSFDCVVSTLTLCSIVNVKQAMAELFRVLKPGGRIMFLEHGQSPDAKVLKWQRRLNLLQSIFADGCSLTLEVSDLIATQPFSSVEMENFYMRETPKTHGYMYRGVAIK